MNNEEREQERLSYFNWRAGTWVASIFISLGVWYAISNGETATQEFLPALVISVTAIIAGIWYIRRRSYQKYFLADDRETVKEVSDHSSSSAQDSNSYMKIREV